MFSYYGQQVNFRESTHCTKTSENLRDNRVFILRCVHKVCLLTVLVWWNSTLLEQLGKQDNIRFLFRRALT